METGTPREPASHRRIERWLFAAALLTALIAVVFWWRISQMEDTSFANDPRFVITSAPNISFPTAKAPFTQRILIGMIKLEQKLRKPRPAFANSMFTASPTTRCSIYGLLNQCTGVTGVRYVIPRDISAATIMFGNTNTLTGPQWVRAFTETIEHSQAEFWDQQTTTMRKENLVLLTNSPRTVLVLPKSRLSEFQRQAAK